jgi:hypothetical protein
LNPALGLKPLVTQLATGLTHSRDGLQGRAGRLRSWPIRPKRGGGATRVAAAGKAALRSPVRVVRLPGAEASTAEGGYLRQRREVVVISMDEVRRLSGTGWWCSSAAGRTGGRGGGFSPTMRCNVGA